jgi:hypothetical protein
MKVVPYTTNYTLKYPREAQRHHILAECPDGSQIEPEHRAAGTEGKPLCEECKRIQEARGARSRRPT